MATENPFFEDRKKAAEAIFGREQDVAFRVRVRHSKLLAQWVAERIGLNAAEAGSYAAEIVAIAAEKPEEAVAKRLFDDLTGKDVSLAEGEFRRKVETLREEAAGQIRAEG